MSAVSEFDRISRIITDERGEKYGDPRDSFLRIHLIKKAVSKCPNAAIKHALELMAVKIVRFADMPTVANLDELIDISGYARCCAMILDHEREIIKDAEDAMDKKVISETVRSQKTYAEYDI
jgi:hypothetical protein